MHFVPRKNHSVRWDEMNCHAGDIGCNRFLDGNLDKFQDYLIDKYGRDLVNQLIERRHSAMKLMKWEIQEKITMYKNRITGLKVIAQ